jgi:hypothetical protein
MATESSLKIGSSVLAIALFGAMSLQTGFAQEPRSDARDDHAPSSASEPHGRPPPAGEDAPGNAAKSNHHSSGAGDDGKVPGRETPPAAADPPAKERANAGDIDTSITVQPHRSHPRPGQAAQVKTTIKPLGAVNLRRRVLPTTEPIIRNAISAPVAVHAGGERRDGVHLDAPIIGRGTVGSPGTAGAVVGHVARTEGRIERPTSNVNPIAAPAAAHRATVSTTGFIHRAVGPAALGGSTMTTAGINGTTIRPKH